MPIPDVKKLKSTMTEEEMANEYTKLGWKKFLRFDWIQSNPQRGSLQAITYEFRADSMPCILTPDCGIHQLSFIEFTEMGVVKTCGVCRTTEGPITMELGRKRTVKDVTIDEAWDILDKTGQKPPIGMPKRRSGSPVRIL